MALLDFPANVAGLVVDPIAAKIKNPFNTNVSAGSVRKDDFTGGLEIIEYIDGKPQPGQKITLIGNMMPMVPFSYGGEQRVSKDYYPGNSEPSVQILGPKEADVSINGTFKDKRYKDEDLYGVAYEIAKKVDAMRIRGNLVKITMGEWRRYGFISECNFKMKKLSWVDYEIKFSIVGFNPPTNCKLTIDPKDAPIKINNDLINSALQFQSTYSSIPKSMPQSIAGLLNSYISDVAKDINLVTGFVDTVVSTAEDVQASANRAIGLIKNARASVSKFFRRVGSIATGFSSLSTQAKAASKFTDTYQNQLHLVGAVSAAADLQALLARMQAQFKALAQTVPMARYRVKKGDTLQNIAMKYYGSSDNWNKIYDHNLLHSTVLTEGAVLEIPKI